MGRLARPTQGANAEQATQGRSTGLQREAGVSLPVCMADASKALTTATMAAMLLRCGA
jgi:hypothetical protein